MWRAVGACCRSSTDWGLSYSQARLESHLADHMSKVAGTSVGEIHDG